MLWYLSMMQNLSATPLHKYPAKYKADLITLLLNDSIWRTKLF